MAFLSFSANPCSKLLSLIVTFKIPCFIPKTKNSNPISRREIFF